MITEQELLEAIAECQGQRSPNANTCIKLASYYTILNQMKEREPMAEIKKSYSFAAANPGAVEYASDTEFGKTVYGKDENKVLGTMDELMTTLQEVFPRLYAGVIERLK